MTAEMDEGKHIVCNGYGGCRRYREWWLSYFSLLFYFYLWCLISLGRFEGAATTSGVPASTLFSFHGCSFCFPSLSMNLVGSSTSECYKVEMNVKVSIFVKWFIFSINLKWWVKFCFKLVVLQFFCCLLFCNFSCSECYCVVSCVETMVFFFFFLLSSETMALLINIWVWISS